MCPIIYTPTMITVTHIVAKPADIDKLLCAAVLSVFRSCRLVPRGQSRVSGWFTNKHFHFRPVAVPQFCGTSHGPGSQRQTKRLKCRIKKHISNAAYSVYQEYQHEYQARSIERYHKIITCNRLESTLAEERGNAAAGSLRIARHGFAAVYTASAQPMITTIYICRIGLPSHRQRARLPPFLYGKPAG